MTSVSAGHIIIYIDTDPTNRERAATAAVKFRTSSPEVAIGREAEHKIILCRLDMVPALSRAQPEHIASTILDTHKHNSL